MKIDFCMNIHIYHYHAYASNMTYSYIYLVYNVYTGIHV